MAYEPGDREVKMYFDRGWYLLGVFGLVLFGPLLMAAGYWLAGVVCFLVGVAVFAYWKAKACTSKDIDRLWKKIAMKQLERAVKAFGVSAKEIEVGPLLLWEPDEEPYIADDTAYPLRERDGRVSAKVIVVILLGKQQVFLYEVGVNIFTGLRRKPVTDEYFYSDIVSIQGDEDGYDIEASSGSSMWFPAVPALGMKGKMGAEEVADDLRRRIREAKRAKAG